MVTQKVGADNNGDPSNLPTDLTSQDQPRNFSTKSPWAEESRENAWRDAPPTRPPPPPQAEGASNIRPEDVPAALRPGQGRFPNIEDDDDNNVWDEARRQPQEDIHTGAESNVPDTLKPGRSATNPFRRKAVGAGQEEAAGQSSTPSALVVNLPTETFARLDLDEQPSNPWQSTSHSAQPSPSETKQQPAFSNGADSDPWAEIDPVSNQHQQQQQQQHQQQQPTAASPALLSLPSEEESAWDDVQRPRNDNTPPRPPMTAMSDELADDQHVWDDVRGIGKGKGKATGSLSEGQDEWNMLDTDDESAPASPQKPSLLDIQDAPQDVKPPVPARTQEEPRWVPTRQPVDGKAETYQIKNTRWHDPNSRKNPRTSPILVQNENGPCPLVALVNALSLTTPSDIEDTSLVQVLRSREQVSLNLVLDAVFDELMSPRRTGSDFALPDVGDLYAFLQSLHTGMNVNPRFVPAPEVVEAYKTSSLTHLSPEERENIIPGTFENTAEMGLYATFSIPLIHGWLPPPSEPAYAAMKRQAVSYEDVQNLLFREEELEQKLSNPGAGLSEQEQQLYQDIITIKTFLDMSATQLTPYGINVIGKAMRPGTFAIFFRNDHFSTLYCHPETNHLLTLVTDAGYRSHDEVVWETLVDVNGEQSRFLAGDFRVVGGAGASSGPSGSNLGAANYSVDEGAGDWTTVQGRRGKSRQEGPHDVGTEGIPLSSTEQEDRDLALALQLQEEEEHRQREHEQRQQQESRLSEQFIEQQGHHRPQPVNRERSAQNSGNVGGQADLVPGRRSSNISNVPVTGSSNASEVPPPQPPRSMIDGRPAVPARRRGVAPRPEDGAGLDDIPPTYEQAALDPAFEPPVGHPTHERSSTASGESAVRPPAGGASRGGRGGSTGMRPQAAGRGRPMASAGMAGGTSGLQSRDRDCVVM